jgi:uncharacterized membrane protein YfcA
MVLAQDLQIPRVDLGWSAPMSLIFLAIGALLGLLGGGGSILAVPALTYAFGLTAEAAIASSLLIVSVASLAAVAVHAVAGRVAWKQGLMFGAASMAGAYVFGALAKSLGGPLLLAIFTAIMAVTGAAMLRPQRPRKVTSEPAAPQSFATRVKMAVIGFAVGGVTGLVGAGGGFVIVPVLLMTTTMPVGKAVGTSLLVITLNTLAGFVGHAADADLDFGLIGLATALTAVSAAAGAKLAGRVAPERLRGAFGVLVLAIATSMTMKQLPPSFFVAGTLPAIAIGAAVGSIATWVLMARAAAAKRSPPIDLTGGAGI